MKENGISHQNITYWWPRSNSEAENFMKPLTKAIQSSHAKERDWKKNLYTFMLNYRATQHCTTGILPSQFLFNGKIKTILPQVETDDNFRNNYLDVKQKMKEKADRKTQAQVSDVKIGETVIFSERKKKKFVRDVTSHLSK